MSTKSSQELLQLVEGLSLLPEDRCLLSPFLQQLINPSEAYAPNTTSFDTSISCLSNIQQSTSVPLEILSYHLANFPGHSTPYTLFQFYSRAWQILPETVWSNPQGDEAVLLDKTTSQLKESYGDLKSLLSPDVLGAAIIDASSGRKLTHQALFQFIDNFTLPVDLTTGRPIVAIALPNGSLLGLALFATVAYYTAAPINTSGGQDQFRSDLLLTRPRCVLTIRGDVERLGLDEKWVVDAGIQVLLLEQKDDLTFTVEALDPPERFEVVRRRLNGPDDMALILFTSGTSGTKKMVPVSLQTMVSGTFSVVESWGLTPKDACLNMMPLNHVYVSPVLPHSSSSNYSRGGIVRNLFAPVLSRGSTILCSAFDPNLFWDLVRDGEPTWYYASPSMHMSILAEQENQAPDFTTHSIRLICNAAGGLLPSLAITLRDTFQATVLPSYGMTECMPICTPPLDYKLDRRGTSGKACGPQIAILDSENKPVPTLKTGHISVRGGPTFMGYLRANDEIDKSSLDANGYFDTGDLGYLDHDGFLYITGRSKEVINRGGEIISPFEVEEAITAAAQTPDSPIYQRVNGVLAFSAPHNLLQEVVGVAVVVPSGQKRPDLRQIQAAVKTSLHASKWPVALVYMDDLPKSNNKVLRIGLASRMDFDPLADGLVLADRHFEATCPPVNSSLRLKIPKNSCSIDRQIVRNTIMENLHEKVDVFVVVNPHDGYPEVVLAPPSASSIVLEEDDLISKVQKIAADVLDNHLLLPSTYICLNVPLPLDDNGNVDEEMVREKVHERKLASAAALSPTEEVIRDLFASILLCPSEDITVDSDFFDLGGDSLSAGRFLSTMRRKLGASLPVEKFFNASRLRDIGSAVDSILSLKSESSSRTQVEELPLPGCEKTYSSTNPLLLVIQLLPIILFYPMKAALRWTMLIYSLSILTGYWYNPNIAARFFALILAITMSRVATYILGPFVGIAIKWIVIGQYEEGLYPMWGPYHTRWWLVQKILVVFGKGIFSQFGFTRIIYYRLLGAKIGKGVKIEAGAVLGEYDLLEIGDYVQIEPSVCRPFAVERNTSMYLGKIVLGNHSSVGLKAIVAPGSVVPEGHCIGPNSSSHEMDEETGANPHLSRNQIPECHLLLKIFAIFPIKVIVVFVAALPWMGGLFGIVSNQPEFSPDEMRTILLWWASPGRVGFHYLAGQLNNIFRPLVWIVLIIFIKKISDKLIGKTKPGPIKSMSQLERFRLSLLKSLMPGGSVHSVTSLFGTHYEATSIIVRALGAKVGSRVYWPGTGPSIQNYDLLEVGDDVVFGSRSHIITTDNIGNDMVQIGSGSMVADRVMLLPGATIGERVVLGSGAITERGKHYPSGSVWVGSYKGSPVQLATFDKMSAAGTDSSTSTLELTKVEFDVEKQDMEKQLDDLPSSGSSMTSNGGDEEKTHDDEKILTVQRQPTFSPFGKAFYRGEANYHVIGIFGITLYSVFTITFTRAYWDAPTISMIQCLALLERHRPGLFAIHWYRPIVIYSLSVAITSFFVICLTILALIIVISAKWLLLGRRKVGSYDWDKSSYCQRWQIFLTIETLRRKCFGGYGILGMISGTHYAVLYFRALGATIGKDCALFAGGRPSLVFTEPDLLELGDRVTIDDVSLVSHINSRGNFRLNQLRVGSRTVLRSGSRLLSGAQMGDDSCLLEHTLVMAGDFADERMTYQGWPAAVFTKSRVNFVNREPKW